MSTLKMQIWLWYFSTQLEKNVPDKINIFIPCYIYYQQVSVPKINQNGILVTKMIYKIINTVCDIYSLAWSTACSRRDWNLDLDSPFMSAKIKHKKNT